MDLGEFALKLAAVAVAQHTTLERGLDAAARVVQQAARDKIGHYQDESAPFPGWAPLKLTTIAERIRLGYTPNDPLLRDGTLRASIVRETHGLEAVIGSKMPIAAYQEFGTSRIPPRPFIGPAALENRDEILRLAGRAMMAGLGFGAGPSYDAVAE